MAQKSISDFDDCEEVFERAVASAKGIRLSKESPTHATAYMQRLNTYRSKLRKTSEEVYPVGHPERGRSPYDGFILRKDPANTSAILIQPKIITENKIEEL